MQDASDIEARRTVSRTRVILALLFVAGLFIMIATLAWAFVRFWQLSQSDASSLIEFIGVFSIMLVGVGGGVLAWGMEELIRQLSGLHDAVEQISVSNVDTPDRAVPRGKTNMLNNDVSEATLHEMVLLLREVRDISLLTADQRSMRLDVQGKAAVAALERDVPVLLREHNWIEARRRVQEARERYPAFAQWDALERQIEQMRNQVESHDVDGAERQIHDLVMLGAWDRVSEVIEEMLERHPESPRAHELAQRVTSQRNQAESEQRRALMNKAQEATNSRDWATALELSTTLIQNYPRSPEAQALRLQLPTLRENAEVRERQNLEMQFRDCWQQRRYKDALRVAEYVLKRFPNSPQAGVLRDSIPKLRELAYG